MGLLKKNPDGSVSPFGQPSVPKKEEQAADIPIPIPPRPQMQFEQRHAQPLPQQMMEYDEALRVVEAKRQEDAARQEIIQRQMMEQELARQQFAAQQQAAVDSRIANFHIVLQGLGDDRQVDIGIRMSEADGFNDKLLHAMSEGLPMQINNRVINGKFVTCFWFD